MAPRRASILALALGAAALFQGCGPAAPLARPGGSPDSPSSRPVYAVQALDLSIDDAASRTLCVTASGTVRTGGWSAGTLQPVGPLQPSPDGVAEFQFMATPPPPDAMVTQALTPIASRPFCWRDYPPGLKAIRLRAETNLLQRALP